LPRKVMLCGGIPDKLVNREVWDKPKLKSNWQDFRTDVKYRV